MEDAAIAAFIAEYVDIPCKMPALRGFMDLVTPLFTNSSSESSMRYALQAIAFSSVYLDPNRRNMAHWANTYYGKALKSINESLRDPERALTDETLMAILLCSQYEVS